MPFPGEFCCIGVESKLNCLLKACVRSTYRFRAVDRRKFQFLGYKVPSSLAGYVRAISAAVSPGGNLVDMAWVVTSAGDFPEAMAEQPVTVALSRLRRKSM
jgi:hypothetical protein